MKLHMISNVKGELVRISHEVIVNLIAGTTNKAGLIHAELDKTSYQPGIKVSKKDFQNINIKRKEFHGEWNYMILLNSA